MEREGRHFPSVCSPAERLARKLLGPRFLKSALFWRTGGVGIFRTYVDMKAALTLATFKSPEPYIYLGMRLSHRNPILERFKLVALSVHTHAHIFLYVSSLLFDFLISDNDIHYCLNTTARFSLVLLFQSHALYKVCGAMRACDLPNRKRTVLLSPHLAWSPFPASLPLEILPSGQS